MNLSLGSFQKVFGLEAAEAIEPPGTKPGSENPPINSAVIRAFPSNAGTVFVGAAGVNAASGFPLEKGDSLSVDAQGLGNLFGFATKAADKVAVFWLGP